MNIINDDGYFGGRWVRVDFHLHTPGVSTFHCPNGLDPKNPEHRDQIVQNYVERLLENKIQIAAITDYNGVRAEWFYPIREEANKQGIIIYPGAELSFSSAGKYGLHIITIFPLSTDVEAINRAINVLDKDPITCLFDENGNHRNIESKDRVEEALLCIQNQLGAVLIVAHPDGNKGLFKSFRPQSSAKFLNDVRPDAIESFSQNDILRLSSTGEIDGDYLSGIADVCFSDPKSLEEIGSKTQSDGKIRSTYLKISEFADLDAIRLALHDPKIRICCEEPPNPNYTRIKSLEVNGSGFLGGNKLILSPELNVIIGGRGVGKSAILELIRYVLDLKPYVSKEYRENLIKYALGSGGKVSLCIQQVIAPNVRLNYRIERIYGEPPRIIDIDSNRDVELAPCDMLANSGELPLFFGQREINEITRDEKQRLRLLDEIIGRETKNKLQQVQRLDEELKRNARELINLEENIKQKEDKIRELKEIEYDIELYQREGLAEKLELDTLLTRDEELLNRAKSDLDEADIKWNDAINEITSKLSGAINQLGRAQSPNKSILGDAVNTISELHFNICNLFEQGKNTFDTTNEGLIGCLRDWKKQRRLLDEDIQKIKQELGDQTLDPDRLNDLTRTQTRLKLDLETIASTEKMRDEVQARRKQIMRELIDTHYLIFELRRNQAELLSKQLDGTVRVSVEYKGQKIAFIDKITNLLRGSGVDRKTIEKICDSDSKNIDGQYIANAVRKGTDKIQEDFGITASKANTIYNWLSQDRNRLFEMELLFPDDLVKVLLKIEGNEVSLEKLSDGQRATAILLLLLARTERLLIVDQPEDDLDNRFIYEAIVRILRDQKGKRQIIAATHNPNIPVLGDAELIVALDASEGKARTLEQGAIDRENVREAVKRIMEGGEEAFRRRAEKYSRLYTKSY